MFDRRELMSPLATPSQSLVITAEARGNGNKCGNALHLLVAPLGSLFTGPRVILRTGRHLYKWTRVLIMYTSTQKTMQIDYRPQKSRWAAKRK